MKKEYIKPLAEIFQNRLQHMICLSVDQEATAGNGEWSEPQSLDTISDLFEEEE